MMNTTTDRLIARLIYVTQQAAREGGYWPDDGSVLQSEADILAAAERLALAEQSVTAEPVPALEKIKSDACHPDSVLWRATDNGQFRDAILDLAEASYGAGLDAKAAEPPRADWIEAAKRKAIEAYQVSYGNGPVMVLAVLDAFIAAMPKDEAEALRELIRHACIHSGYRNCGYQQMTTEQKALYCQTVNELSPAPQPEEVPGDVLHDGWGAFIHQGGCASTVGSVHAAVAVGWSAARRYSPMPAQITAEMHAAIQQAAKDDGVSPYVAQRIVEAALSAAKE